MSSVQFSSGMLQAFELMTAACISYTSQSRYSCFGQAVDELRKEAEPVPVPAVPGVERVFVL